jgi:hypothetical protein
VQSSKIPVADTPSGHTALKNETTSQLIAAIMRAVVVPAPKGRPNEALAPVIHITININPAPGELEPAK